VRNFRWKFGSIQSKSVSLLTFASIILTPVATAYASFGDGTPTIPNPSVFGQTIDQDRIDGASGAFTQKISLDIPPGRNGLQPDVSLQYNSQNTSDGVVGYGWSLSIPYIERLNKTGSQDLYGSNPYFTSSIDGELASEATTSPVTVAPTILDTIPSSGLMHSLQGGTSISFSYTVPSGGENKLLIVMWSGSNATPTAMTLNGTSFASSAYVWPASSCAPGMTYHWYAYLAAPTSGTFNMQWSATENANIAAFTVRDAEQTNPIDAAHLTCGTGSSKSTSVTTTVGNDLLLSYPVWSSAGNFSSYGAGEAQITNGENAGWSSEERPSWKAAASSAGTETMTTNIDSSRSIDLMVVAVKAADGVVSEIGSNTYTYAGTGYANPHTLTELSNGVSTSTFAYDNNGNLTQKTTDGVTTTYLWDYANRLIALGVNSATTTYGYDAFGSRVLQTTATNTNIYPFKWFSVASSTGTGAQFSTTTEYVFSGDILVSTIDQQLAGGAATGSPQTFYIHPDHLGSTNVITNASGTVVTTKDYYPYGSLRVNSGSASLARGYIGQFEDQSNLSYLNARYYDSGRGQFISQDPVFWEIGLTQDGKNVLLDPQALNSYAYANGNPITKKDPTGRCPWCGLALLGAGGGIVGQYGYDVFNNFQNNGISASNFYSGLSSPETYLTRAGQGVAVALTGGTAAAAGWGIAGQATAVGLATGGTGAGGNYILGQPITAQSVFFDAVFGGLTFGALKSVPAVRGRLPNFATQSFFAGKHTQQSAMHLGVESISNYTSQLMGNGGASSPQAAAKALGIGNGGTGTFVGTFNFGPGVGTFDFGKEAWVPTAQSTPTTKKRSRRKISRNGVTIYKANKLVGLPALLIPALLIIPVLNSEVPLESRLIGLGIFLVITVAIVVVPFGARLEVGDNHVATYLFGFSTMPRIYRSDIQVIVYRNLFHGGLGAGKGISFRALVRGRSKAYSIGEAMYGKEAIAHARRVLGAL